MFQYGCKSSCRAVTARHGDGTRCHTYEWVYVKNLGDDEWHHVLQYDDAHQEDKHQHECLTALSEHLEIGLEAYGGEEGEHEDILQSAIKRKFDVEYLVEDKGGDRENESSRYWRRYTELL